MPTFQAADHFDHTFDMDEPSWEHLERQFLRTEEHVLDDSFDGAAVAPSSVTASSTAAVLASASTAAAPVPKAGVTLPASLPLAQQDTTHALLPVGLPAATSASSGAIAAAGQASDQRHVPGAAPAAFRAVGVPAAAGTFTSQPAVHPWPAQSTPQTMQRTDQGFVQPLSRAALSSTAPEDGSELRLERKMVSMCDRLWEKVAQIEDVVGFLHAESKRLNDSLVLRNILGSPEHSEQPVAPHVLVAGVSAGPSLEGSSLPIAQMREWLREELAVERQEREASHARLVQMLGDHQAKLVKNGADLGELSTRLSAEEKFRNLETRMAEQLEACRRENKHLATEVEVIKAAHKPEELVQVRGFLATLPPWLERLQQENADAQGTLAQEVGHRKQLEHILCQVEAGMAEILEERKGLQPRLGALEASCHELNSLVGSAQDKMDQHRHALQCSEWQREGRSSLQTLRDEVAGRMQGDKLAQQQLQQVQEQLRLHSQQQDQLLHQHDHQYHQQEQQLQGHTQQQQQLQQQLQQLQQQLQLLQQLQQQQLQEHEELMRLELKQAQNRLEQQLCTEAARLDVEVRASELRVGQRCITADASLAAFHEELRSLETASRRERQTVETRSDESLQVGLQKLAAEVAERIEQVRQEHLTQNVATERRLVAGFEPRFLSSERRAEVFDGRLGAADAWQAACHQRQAAHEQRLEAHSELLHAMPEETEHLLDARMQAVRAACKEDIAAMALSAFKSEVRLWAKVAQLSGVPAPGTRLEPRWDGQAWQFHPVA